MVGEEWNRAGPGREKQLGCRTRRGFWGEAIGLCAGVSLTPEGGTGGAKSREVKGRAGRSLPPGGTEGQLSGAE